MLKIAYQGDSFLVVDKPPGLTTTSSQTNKEPSLEDILRTEYGVDVDRGGIVHRLDKDTSGLLLVAKTAEALEHLQAQFKERSVSKEYVTLVHGFIESEGKVDVPIGRNPGDREKFVADAQVPNAREAVTEYKSVQKFEFRISNFEIIFEDFNKIQMRKLEKAQYGKFTLVKAHPLTGRTHQIRVHLKYIGHPVVGDEKYGGRKTARLDKRWVSRQFLHAAKLEFNDPDTGKRITLESPLPEDLEKALNVLEKVS